MAAPPAGIGGGGAAGTNDCWQMTCCLGCFGPFEPSRDALRRDRVGARALNYIEGQVCMHRTEWTCTEEPRLTDEPNDAHIFHRTDIIPVVDLFYQGGSMSSAWVNRNTLGFQYANNDQIVVGQVPRPRWTKIRSGADWRMVFWNRPVPIPGIDSLHRTVEECLRLTTTARMIPNIHAMERICRTCNQFMTQFGTTAHLLARVDLNPNPLVPLDSIYRYNLNLNAAGVYTVTSVRMQDPSLALRNGRYFSYQACMAYYIHRCLPPHPGPLPAPGPVRVAEERRRREWVSLTAALSFILLEIYSLMCENRFGCNGGRTRTRKPAYRYKGMIELYISYYLWIIACNDVAQGQPVNGRGCNMDFCLFHRYFFSNLLEMLTLACPEHAGAIDIRDIIFPPGWIRGGGPPLGGGLRMASPEVVIGFLANRLQVFYYRYLKLYLSRHISNLEPNAALIAPGFAVPVIVGVPIAVIYARQVVAYNMFITVNDLATLMRLCERGIVGDIDSFINNIGVHAVLQQWNKLLRAAPPRADRLIDDLMDTWTMHEYSHIIKTLSTLGQGQPKITGAAAESVYLLCNVINAPMEPNTDEELELLRSAPKCSAAKAALRLIQTGAFQDDDI